MRWAEWTILFAENLMHAFVPGAPPLSGFKYRHIAHERGTYRRLVLRYRPYLGRHEPPNRTSTARRARIVFRRVMAAKDERVAEISHVLRQAGCTLAPEPESWEAIERWIAESVEGSREPGSDRSTPYAPNYPERPPRQIDGESTTVLRPLWLSVMLDLALLLGEHMIARIEGARWSHDGEWREGSCSGEPLVAVTNGQLAEGVTPPTYRPFGDVELVTWRELGRRQQLDDPPPISLGEILRKAIEEPPTPHDPRREFVESLEHYLDEHGDLPENEEILEWIIDYRLLEIPELPSRLAQILDERDRRAGRTGTRAAWRLSAKEQ